MRYIMQANRTILQQNPITKNSVQCSKSDQPIQVKPVIFILRETIITRQVHQTDKYYKQVTTEQLSHCLWAIVNANCWLFMKGKHFLRKKQGDVQINLGLSQDTSRRYVAPRSVVVFTGNEELLITHLATRAIVPVLVLFPTYIIPVDIPNYTNTSPNMLMNIFPVSYKNIEFFEKWVNVPIYVIFFPLPAVCVNIRHISRY